MAHVLDASLILASLNGEPGGEQLPAFMEGAAISVVTYVEVVTKLLDAGATYAVATEAMMELDLPMVEVTEEVAKRAAELRSTTRHHGLSLGDRVCLAMAELLGASAVTADRAWATVEARAPIILIR